VYVLNSWITSIERDAKKFNDALEGWASPSEIMLIKSGEHSGLIVEAMDNAISMTEAAQTAISTIKTKLAYPVILFGILFGMAYLFSTQIVPEFEKLSDPMTWPEDAQSLYKISNIVREDYGTIILGIILSIFGISWTMKNVTGKTRDLLDKLPIYSMYRSFQSSLFLVSLASMMKSGVDLEYSLQQIRKKAPKYTKYELSKVAKRLDRGIDAGEAFNIPFFDEESRIDIGIFSKSKNIGDSIEAIGKQSIKNGVDKISVAADIIKYAMMFAIVGYIGWSYMGFYGLVQSISQNV
jgi:type II secretory pathway component PulF